MNNTKTKAMKVNHASRSPLKIDNREMELVNSFYYPESTITTNGELEADAKCVMSKQKRRSDG